MSETNVVSLFDARKAREPRECVEVTVALNPNIPLHKGGLVAFCHAGGSVSTMRWLGPSGRDWQGRFVKRGSTNERIDLDLGMAYSPEVMRRCGTRIIPVADSPCWSSSPPETAA